MSACDRAATAAPLRSMAMLSALPPVMRGMTRTCSLRPIAASAWPNARYSPLSGPVASG
ncbi:Uncharacterised protein [Bordetella pertussis]|nr:Uncharacterised protein [Bordetella pertussis]CFO01509.1 Uncharacterised protein [Bordetella pertussis]CFP06611.1 Uncharacterised protein [Bordetella pertussis]CFT90380.1 Uncharacterised protein [Bordetella pertussis]CPJ57944.1 Uncharacterised protein [Bordetella pertussis]